MMKYFVSETCAIELKQIGFSELCLTSNASLGNNNPVGFPLYEQAFNWFRTKHKLYSHIEPKLSYPDNYISGGEFHVIIYNEIGDILSSDDVLSYDDAKIMCLETLIQIVKDR